MCIYIKTILVSVLAIYATVVFYCLLCGGIHPLGLKPLTSAVKIFASYPKVVIQLSVHDIVVY